MVYFLLPENRLTWPASGSWDSGTPGKSGRSRRYLKKNFIKISGKSDLVTTQARFFKLLSSFTKASGREKYRLPGFRLLQCEK